ncbi:MAG: hypothetical protein ACRC46_13750 [Thermoguttaceae bacterium]
MFILFLSAMLIPGAFFLEWGMRSWDDRIIKNEIILLDKEIPLESERYESDSGFSIIKPKNWISNERMNSKDSEDRIQFFSNSTRRPHMVSIEFLNADMLRERKDVFSSHKIIQFQGKEEIQYAKIVEAPRSNFGEMNYQSTFCLTLNRNAKNYKIDILLQGKYNEIPKGLLKFLETFIVANDKMSADGKSGRRSVCHI